MDVDCEDEMALGWVADLDLRPLVLQGYWCAVSGLACSFRQKALVSRGGDARELIKWALADIGVGAGGAIGVNDVNLWILRETLRQPSGKRLKAPPVEASADAPHFGFTQHSKSASVDADTQERQHEAWQHGYDDATEEKHAPGRRGGSVMWLRHSADACWQLVEGEQRRVALDRMGVSSGFIAMFESRCLAEGSDDADKSVWPTHRVQESPVFRDFRLWQWVDMLNFSGKWCLAQIVKVFTTEDNRLFDVKHSLRGKSDDAVSTISFLAHQR